MTPASPTPPTAPMPPLHRFVWDVMDNVRTKDEVKVLLPSFDMFSKLMATVQFSPGVQDICTRSTPPTIALLQTLPDAWCKDEWGVYVLIMEKDGARPRIYVGQSCSSRGMRERMREHKRCNSGSEAESAKGVKKATKEGYRITYYNKLASVPLPSQDTDTYRVLMVAIEAAFHCLLWSMISHKAWGFHDRDNIELCPWDKNRYEYTGCNEINPLHCSIPGIVRGKYTGVGNEQGTERQAAIKKEAATIAANWRKANKESNRYFCKDCNRNFATAWTLNTHLDSYEHEAMVKGAKSPEDDGSSVEQDEDDIAREKRRAERAKTQLTFDRKWRAQVIAEKRFYCGLADCDFAFATQGGLDKHLKTPAHKKAAAAAAGDPNILRCGICGSLLSSKKSLTVHNANSKEKHQRILAERAAAAKTAPLVINSDDEDDVKEPPKKKLKIEAF